MNEDESGHEDVCYQNQSNEVDVDDELPYKNITLYRLEYFIS